MPSFFAPSTISFDWLLTVGGRPITETNATKSPISKILHVGFMDSSFWRLSLLRISKSGSLKPAYATYTSTTKNSSMTLRKSDNTCAARIMGEGGETGSRGHLSVQFGGRHGRRNHHPRGCGVALRGSSHCPGLQGSSPKLFRNDVGLGLKLTSEITYTRLSEFGLSSIPRL